PLVLLWLTTKHFIAQCRQASFESIDILQTKLKALPETLERVLLVDKQCQELAAKFAGSTNFLVMGRNIDYPIALEGALKLKETSYIQAEGYPTGEIKHGPAALIDEDLPIVILAARDEGDAASMVRYERTVSNIRSSLYKCLRIESELFVATTSTGLRNLSKSVLVE